MPEPAQPVPSAPARPQWWAEPSMWWLVIPGLGIPGAWWSLGVSYALGTWAAGQPEGWPGPMLTLRAAMGLVRGQRLDVAWLKAGDATAIASAWWLVVFALAAIVLVAALVFVVVEWRAAGWPMPDTAGWSRSNRKAKQNRNRPAQGFVRRTWPIRPPYDHSCPGPGVLIGRKGRRRHLVATDGLPMLVVGPTGSGKTRRVIGPNAAAWPGPVVATSVKKDLAALTLPHRKAKGTVYGFEPTGELHDWMVANGITPVCWDPVRLMMANPTRKNADRISQFLASQSSAHGQGSQAVWPNLVQKAMSDMLVIAAEIGAPLKTVLRWLSKLSSFTDLAKDENFRRRLSPAALDALDELAEDAERDPRLSGSIEVTAIELTRALQWTADEAHDVALVPVDVAMNGRNDTLYLIADHASQTTHKALFGAVLRHVFHVTENTEPDPDVIHLRPQFALDEFANLAKLPDMPEIISTIRARAQVIIGVQTFAQLSRSWQRDGAVVIIDNCSTKLLLPGSSDPSALRDLVTLTGQDEDEDDFELATPADWRMIESGSAVALVGNRQGFIVDLPDPDRWLEPPKSEDGGPPSADTAPEDPEASDGSGDTSEQGGPTGGPDPADTAEMHTISDTADTATLDDEAPRPLAAHFEVLFDQAFASELPQGDDGPVEEARRRIKAEWTAKAPRPKPQRDPQRDGQPALALGSDSDDPRERIKARLLDGTSPPLQQPNQPALALGSDSPGNGHPPLSAQRHVWAVTDDDPDVTVAGDELPGGETTSDQAAAEWMPPPLLDEGDALGIALGGTDFAPPAGDELLKFVDEEGEFGLHPAGCAFDLSKEGDDERDLTFA